MCSSLLIITDFELKPYWNLYIFIRVKICWKLIWKWQIWTARKDAYIDKGVVTVRSRRPEVFCKKGVLRNFPKFTGKHLCQSLFFNTVAGLRPSTLLKKRLWHRCFPVNFVKFLRTPFLTEHFWWLLQSCYCRCLWLH